MDCRIGLGQLLGRLVCAAAYDEISTWLLRYFPYKSEASENALQRGQLFALAYPQCWVGDRNHMNINDKYYGEALRSLERGERRDELWAKAYAKSQGDESRTRALYIELLAGYLAVTDPDLAEERARAEAERANKQKMLSYGSYRLGYNLARKGWGGSLWLIAILIVVIVAVAAGG